MICEVEDLNFHEKLEVIRFGQRHGLAVHMNAMNAAWVRQASERLRANERLRMFNQRLYEWCAPK